HPLPTSISILSLHDALPICFGIDPEKGENAKPDSNAHIVAERGNHPDRAHGGEWNRQCNDHGFHRRSRIAVKQKENDRDSDWHRSEEHTSELHHVAISYAVF